MGLFDDIEIFARVVENGGFARAAQSLGLSRSRVSESVRALETRLGARLFDRTTRRVSPTEAGRTLYTRCRRALDETQAGFDEVAALSAEPAGTLRIGVLPGFSEMYLVPALAGFLRAHPKVRLELVETERTADLVEERLDLAFRLAMSTSPSLIVRRIGEAEVVVVASPEYVERHGQPSHPNDAASHLIVTYAMHFWPSEWRFTGADGAASLPIRPILTCSSTNSLRAAALNGIGLVPIPDWAVRDDLHAGRLVRLFSDWQFPGSGLYAVYPSNRMVTASVRACVEHVARHLRALSDR